MTTNTIEPEAEDTEPKFRTRTEAEVEIALLNEEIESLQDLVKDDIERLEEQRDEIEEQLDDLPDEEVEEKEFANLLAQERKKHDLDDEDDDDEPDAGVVAEIEKFLAQENE